MNENSYRLKSSLRKIAIRASMFLVYIFVGSAIFMLLEKKNSEEKKKITDDWMRLQKDFEKEITTKNNTNQSISEDIKMFTEKIVENVENGRYKSYRYIEWRFVDSFFFCANVITTIGYGHITPTSDAGRVVMMLYALFGIPLTGFFLRTVGNEVTTLIGYLIKLYERKVFNREAEKLEMKCALIACCLALVMLFIGAMAFMLSESKWSYVDSFYFCFVTLTTIGFGDYVPNQDDRLTEVYLLLIELASLIYYVLGLSIMSTVIVSISGVIEEKTRKLDVTDPMEAIRNLRIENLNSKAMKKLGYKVEEGFSLSNGNITLPASNMNPVNDRRRGTIIPDDSFPPLHKKSLTPSLPISLNQNSFVNKGFEANENEKGGHKESTRTEPDVEAQNDKRATSNLQSSTESSGHQTLHAGDINDKFDNYPATPKTSINSINVTSPSSDMNNAGRTVKDTENVNSVCENKQNSSDKMNNINSRKNNNNNKTRNKNKDIKNKSTDLELTQSNKLPRSQNPNLKRKIISKELRKVSGTFKHVGLPSELFASSYSSESDHKYIVRRASSCGIDMKQYRTKPDDSETKRPIKNPLAFTRSISLDTSSYHRPSDRLFNSKDDSPS